MIEPTWRSIGAHEHIPQWLRDCKFGIYTHWGVYSVPACGPNATWYAYNMYRDGSLQNLYHRLHFGDPSKFGYKDFIPMFTAERFDPEEWATLFKASGAGFAGPVGEHHEGFAMWNSRVNPYNAAVMGPKRDVVGELAKAIRGQGMKFMTAMHHAEAWYFYPHWKKQYDVGDPANTFYGEPHNTDWDKLGKEIDPNPYVSNHGIVFPRMDRPGKAFLDSWLEKLKEVTDQYCPDLMWFDFGLKYIREDYKRAFLAYYYNKGEELNRDLCVTYKWHNMVVGSDIEDLEQGKRGDLTYNFWVTDTTVDDGEAWGYIYNNCYKTPETLVHYLIDNVSKNGALILNVGPKADGTIPEEAQHILLEMGRWLSVNGEAIYGTTPWIIAGEGPTKLEHEGAFSDGERLQYTAKDIRYTLKGDALYAIMLGWPGREALLTALTPWIYPDEIEKVELLGADGPLPFKYTQEGLRVALPEKRPCDYAYALKITRRNILH